MRTKKNITQDDLTPQLALKLLTDGNDRFIKNLKTQRNLKEEAIKTSTGQYPFAVILSCIDSRVPVELVFDQGIGDVFSTRIAGNIVNEDVLGSLEYSCKVAGSKLLVVMGHTKCGAVTAACKHVELGNITALLSKIKPVVNSVIGDKEVDENAIEAVAVENVKLSIERIRKESPILAELEQQGEIKIVGSIYDVATGKVDSM